MHGHRGWVFFLVSISIGACAIRLWLAWTAPESLDLQNYQNVVSIVHSGGKLYEATTNYNYSPIWSWLLLVADAVARSVGSTLTVVVRMGLFLIDLGCAAALFLLSRNGGRLRQWRTVALYLSNPMGIWTTAVHGQFDMLAIFFLLAAILVHRDLPEHKRSLIPMSLLTLSIAAKQITVFHSILFIRRRRDLPWLLLPLFAFGALLLPYGHQWRAIRDNVLFYRSVPRSYGFAEIVLYDPRAAGVVGAVAVIAGIVAASLYRRMPLERRSLVVFLTLLFFAPGISTQYFVWPLSFGTLAPGPGYVLFTASSILWTLGSHFSLSGSGRWMGQLVWLSVAYWLVREIALLRRPASPGVNGDDGPANGEQPIRQSDDARSSRQPVAPLVEPPGRCTSAEA